LRLHESESERMGVELAACASCDPRGNHVPKDDRQALRRRRAADLLSTDPSNEARSNDLKGYAQMGFRSTSGFRQVLPSERHGDSATRRLSDWMWPPPMRRTAPAVYALTQKLTEDRTAPPARPDWTSPTAARPSSPV